jgi:Integrase core domain.
MMSAKERDRLTILTQVCEEHLTVADAAELLSISERQAYRILQRFRLEGAKGLLHRLRGHPSNRGYGEELRQRVVHLYWQDYRDYGPTFFSEKLMEHHRLQINHETVRRWLMANGGSNLQRKKRLHRKKRPRRSAKGELLQFDGSDHDWFEGRGPVCTLLHAIDDASSTTFLKFSPSEDTANALITLRGYCEHHGIPRALYTDFDSVYYADKTLTDVGRAMQALGVEIIYASSPQAKGRVERGNRTHQDRLVKELRERGISTIADANRFLATEYLDKHNKRFAVTENLADVHRSIEGYNLDNIFCFQTERHVRNDYTISLAGQYIQLIHGKEPLPPPRHSVTVRRYLNDTLHIFWKELELSFEILDHKPAPKPRTIQIPTATHPWRRSWIGKNRYV